MTKRELIDEIVAINHSASPGFLARFNDGQLEDYLTHLRILETPRLSGDADRYEKYFRGCPTIHARRPAWRTTPEAVEEIVADDYDDEEIPVDEYEGEGEEDFEEQPVTVAERERLYAEPVELAGEPEGDTAEQRDLLDGPAPSRALPRTEAAHLPDDEEDDEPLDEADDVHDEAEPADEPEPAGEPAEPLTAAAHGAQSTPVAIGAAATPDRPGPLFHDADDDSENWLY